LGTDAAFATNPARVGNRVALIEALSALTIEWARDDLLAELEQASVPAGPINSIGEVFDDAQVRHRGMRLDLASGAADGGTIPGVRTPLVIDGIPAAHANPSPRVGEHQTDVLCDPNWVAR